ncbi:CBS domain-containing protein [Candidatus Poribacteria bacterium]|nr:CBS domain-containing protein [Candidatus Poribacteria bacterium]MYG05213.1 CBS domain-containing protein [Candidatus Poribacteria bacterium]MYK22763.1 CBS domain-containing protein [Candidatus Poribacteria bacterium]
MLYDLAIDEELEQMDEDAALKAWSAQEIQVSLKDLMRPIVTIDITYSANEAIDLLLTNKIGAAPVIENGLLRGIFSERDVLNKILNKQIGNLDVISVKEFMIADPQTAKPEDSLNTAILYMARGGYRHVPIVDTENRPLGMVSIRDVISYLIEEFPQEVLTLPPRPVRDAFKAREGA